MIATLTDWIKTIIFVVLFASFLELLLPSSNMQRFIRMIMGLFIMMAILHPVLDMAEQYIVPKQVTALSTQSALGIGSIQQMQSTIARQEVIAKEFYKKELAKQIRVMITAVEGVADAKVLVQTKDEGVKSVVERIEVYLTLSSEAKQVKISTVRIKESSGEENNDTAMQEKIKKILKELYQVPIERVEVKILHS